MSNQLVKLDQARQLLSECVAVDEAKNIRDAAVAAQHYAKVKGLGIDAELYANEIKALAVRRMGEILRNMGKNKGAAQQRGTTDGTALPPTLSDIGVTKKESSLAQAVASIPDDDFTEYLNKAKAAHKPISDNDLSKMARKIVNVERESFALSNVPDGVLWNITPDQSVVACDLLITDPPYGILDEQWEPDDLKMFTLDWLTRWNECQADLILSFWSQEFMWDGRQWFDQALPDYMFQQLLVWHYPNNKGPQSRQMFKQTWEPIFMYRRRDTLRPVNPYGAQWGGGLNDFDCHVAAIPQSNFNDIDFKQHAAQKPISVMNWLVNAVSRPGELICDPFCGSGTTGIAATKSGRRFHGIESDPEILELARRRLATYGA